MAYLNSNQRALRKVESKMARTRLRRREKPWDCVEVEVFSTTQSEDEVKVDCSICLQSYVEREKLVRLPCGHKFHVVCLDSWIRIRFNCPYCRRFLRVRIVD
ncbi:43kDa postsynaptic protein [Parasponia andersonii]|uniref:43kDa postsynaptic protein n=1 Tax=Parasponia andersonii TaxID=3476 RepID=A0A2P5AWA0_PARAD|nr:43kDa postsynaptic protein [Parasponia andersonii]